MTLIIYFMKLFFALSLLRDMVYLPFKGLNVKRAWALKNTYIYVVVSSTHCFTSNLYLKLMNTYIHNQENFFEATKLHLCTLKPFYFCLLGPQTWNLVGTVKRKSWKTKYFHKTKLLFKCHLISYILLSSLFSNVKFNGLKL